MNFDNIIQKRNRLTRDGQIPLLTAIRDEFVARIWRNKSVRQMVGMPLKTRLPKNTVFLTGCFNSGTTILRDIIGSHPDIGSLPREGVVYSGSLSDYETGEWTRLFCNAVQIEEINRQTFAELEKNTLYEDWRPWISEESYLLEKSISHIARMTELQSLIPECRFIVVNREPYGVCEGIVRRTRRQRVGDAVKPDHGDAARQWMLCRKLVELQSPSLEHLLNIAYEDFIKDPVTQLNLIFEFIGARPIAQLKDGQVVVGAMSWAIRDGNQASRVQLGDAARSEIDETLASSTT